MANIKVVGVDITTGQEKILVGGDTIRPDTGALTISSGNGAGSGAGGSLVAQAGSGGNSNGNGGQTIIYGGSGTSQGNGGNLVLAGGTSGSSAYTSTATQGMNGQLGDIVLIDGAVLSTEAASVLRRYLATKYGVTLP